MPRFFFHLQQSERRLDDRAGQILQDADAAWEAAKAAARTLIASDPSRQDIWITSTFEVTDEEGEVTDEEGEIVLEFPFVEAIDPRGELN